MTRTVMTMRSVTHPVRVTRILPASTITPCSRLPDSRQRSQSACNMADAT